MRIGRYSDEVLPEKLDGWCAAKYAIFPTSFPGLFPPSREKPWERGCDFPYAFYDLTKNLIPYSGRDLKINILFRSCLTISSQSPDQCLRHCEGFNTYLLVDGV